MGAYRVKYIWTVKNSTTCPDSHYSIEMWAFGNYDLGESLALIMGFLEPDPNHPEVQEAWQQGLWLLW